MIDRLSAAGTVLIALVVTGSVRAQDWYGRSYGPVYQAPTGYVGIGYRPYFQSYPSVARQYGSHAFHSNRIAPHMAPYSANPRYNPVPVPARSWGRPMYSRSLR